MKAIVYRLRLLEPVLVAQAGAGEENSAIGLPYIPGSALRGALAARWLAGHPGADLASDPIGRAWFLDGTVCHLNAYPEYDGERTLPTPASWFTSKDLASDPLATIYDLAAGPDPKLGVLKPPKGGPFCRPTRFVPEDAWLPVEHRAELVKPTRNELVHIALEDVNRRGEGNQVFRYDALAPAQNFIGVMIASEDYDLTLLKDLLTANDLLLGSAHLAGYGRVAVEDMREVTAGWTECTVNGPAPNGHLVVTLLSHAIVRGVDGQIGWDGGQAIAAAFGCQQDTKPLAVFGHTELAGGYNRKWSMPIPQAWALAAGSVFVFDAQAVDQTALQVAVDRGLGERRAEGFGRIAANWQVTAQVYQDKPKPVEVVSPVLSAESQRQARAMAQRRLRVVLDRELARQVNVEAERMKRIPEKAQLSAIRQATLTGLAQGDLKPLLNYLDNLKETGRLQLESCQMGNQSLLAWLRDRAKALDVKEQLLGTTSLPTVAGQTAALDRDLRAEYTSRLIDGVMRLAVKRKQEAKR